MKIKNLGITNFKSLRILNIWNPNSFSVFVGPNGAGKSNIFEALEFAVYSLTTPIVPVVSMFKGAKSILSYNNLSFDVYVGMENEKGRLFGTKVNMNWFLTNENNVKIQELKSELLDNLGEDQQRFAEGFSRLFLNKPELVKIKVDDDRSLALDGSNLEKVLNRILQDKIKREEIIEWLQILIPEFKNIEIEIASLSGEVNYVIYEKHTNKPFPKHLISDGTKNILALLTAVYQSDEPQFLCIEEPENGLHPHVIENLVSFFRNACKEKGHVIWLNSHSQTLVRQLTADEIIVVEKKKGETTVRQFQGEDFFGLKMDDAWLTNALGGGLP